MKEHVHFIFGWQGIKTSTANKHFTFLSLIYPCLADVGAVVPYTKLCDLWFSSFCVFVFLSVFFLNLIYAPKFI